MTTGLNIALNVLLAASCVFFLGSVFWVALRTEDPLERMLRAAALFAGALTVLVSQVSGASYAQFSLDALGGARPATGAAKALSAILPGLVGVGMGYYITRAIQQSEALAIRLMSFVGMLAAAQFVLLYGIAVSHKGLHLGLSALPNAAFVVGIVLYTVFKLDPEKVRRKSRARRYGGDGGGSPLLSLFRNPSDPFQRRRVGADPPPEAPRATEPR